MSGVMWKELGGIEDLVVQMYNFFADKKVQLGQNMERERMDSYR